MRAAKGTIDELLQSEREVLANWYDTPSYLALKKLLNLERVNIASKLVDIDPTQIVAVARHQGRADVCKQLHLTLMRNHTAQVAIEKKKSRQKT